MSSTNNSDDNTTLANPASSSSSDDNKTAPSLIASHASYAVGAAESTIGSLASNVSLQEAGESTKKQAVEDMRAADKAGKSSTTPSSTGGGLAAKAEETVGGIVGCGGLQDKGAQAQVQDKEAKVKEA